MSLLRKASIVTTPTSYENGKILSVKPSVVLGGEIVTNGDFATDSDWTKSGGATISNGMANFLTGSSKIAQSISAPTQDRVYRVEFYSNQINLSTTAVLIYGSGFYGSSNIPSVGKNILYITTNISGGSQTNKIQLTGGSNGTIDNFSVKEAIDADFDFTRNSSATRVNSQGLIEDMQILSGDLVSNGDFSQEGSELVTNGDFATDTNWVKGTGWTISGGAASCDGTQTSNSQLRSAFFDFSVDTTVKLSFDVINYSSGNLNVSVTGTGQADITGINANGTYSVIVVSSAGSRQIQFTADSNFIGSIDNVSVKEVGQDWSSYDGNVIFKQGSVQIDTNGTAYTELRAGNNFNSPDAILTIGNKYRLTYTISELNSGEIKTNSLIANDTILTSTVGTHTIEGLANLTSLGILRSGDTDITITNISIIEITEDTNLPRIDYTGGEGHWLFEPQSTNLVTYSEDFSQWGQSGAPALTSGQLAPDGTFGATKISGTIGSSYIALAQASTTTATRTIYAKTVSGTGTAKLMSYSGNTNNLFTLTEEWQRFELTGSSAVGATSFYIDLRDNAQTLSEFIIWGAQSEELSFATSYIPTNGSTVTRLEDAASGAGSSDLINSTEGVLYAEIAALTQTPDANQSIALSDGTGNNNIVRIRFLKTSDNTIRVQVRSGGAITVSVSGIVTDIKDFHKVAISYKVNEVKFYIDGVLIHTDTIADMPIGLNQLSFSDGNGILNNFFGKTKCVAVFKEALTDAELTCLTTI